MSLLLTILEHLFPFLAVNVRKRGQSKVLIKLAKAPLGGRRCECVGLEDRSDLNGMACIATRYVPAEDKYVVEVE